MSRRRLQVIEDYEVTGLPIVSATRLTYVRWIERAVLPYAATRLPVGGGTGLAEALRRAAADDSADWPQPLPERAAVPVGCRPDPGRAGTRSAGGLGYLALAGLRGKSTAVAGQRSRLF